MAEWQPIETKPPHPMPVLFYFAKRFFTDSKTGARVEGRDAFRDENAEVGFWDGAEWCENGTAHNVFEDWRDETETPTHWQPLPEPPTP